MQKVARSFFVRASQPVSSKQCAQVHAFQTIPIALRRRFSYSRQRSLEASVRPNHPEATDEEDELLGGNVPKFQINIPKGERQQDANNWVEALEPLLPPTLREQKGDGVETTPSYSSADLTCEISYWLNCAQRHASLDILSHLGIGLGRWDTVAWVVKTAVEGYQDIELLPERHRMAYGSLWPARITLREMTLAPIKLETVGHGYSTHYSLDYNLSFESNPQQTTKRLQKDAIGQIWRTLGDLILRAATSTPEVSSSIMPQVLALIATLHHYNVMPQSVYSDSLTPNMSAIQQPPMLHLLSSRILTALSDAAWNARQVSSNIKTTKRTSQYTFEMPGTRYKSQIEELRPEIWLELVLWSCLHGGWVIDGALILKAMQSYTDASAWSLICWRQIIQDLRADSGHDSPIKWTDLMDIMEGARPQLRKQLSDESGQIEQTVSSELVSAYIDGLVNIIDVGIGEQTTSASVIISHIKGLKTLLDERNLGLGYTTWDATVQRLIESEGFIVDNNPDLVLDTLNLGRQYGEEVAFLNAPNEGSIEHPTANYVLEPSAVLLSLYHRVMYAYCNVGAVEGAIATFHALQQYTDSNKRRSIEKFFHDMKTKPHEPLAMFSPATVQPELDYPSFSPQIQPPVLGPLLDLLTDAQIPDLPGWLVYSKDLDGPIIPESLYAEPALAPSLIRFATSFRQKTLLAEIIKVQSQLTKQGTPIFPRPILLALLQAQIQHRRWDHVHRVLSMTSKDRTSNLWHPTIATALAKEMLLLQQRVLQTGGREDSESLAKATEIFRNLFNFVYGRTSRQSGVYEGYEVLHSILGVLSSINPDWAAFCDNLSPLKGSQPLAMPKKEFNTILEGVVEAHGLENGRRLWETWCADITKAAPKSSRDVEKIPNQFISRGADYFDSQNRVVLDNLPCGPLVFRGRFKPTFATLRVILRKLVESDGLEVWSDQSQTNTPSTRSEMVDWALTMFKCLNLKEEHSELELKRLQGSLRWKRKA